MSDEEEDELERARRWIPGGDTASPLRVARWTRRAAPEILRGRSRLGPRPERTAEPTPITFSPEAPELDARDLGVAAYQRFARR